MADRGGHGYMEERLIPKWKSLSKHQLITVHAHLQQTPIKCRHIVYAYKPEFELSVAVNAYANNNSQQSCKQYYYCYNYAD